MTTNDRWRSIDRGWIEVSGGLSTTCAIDIYSGGGEEQVLHHVRLLAIFIRSISWPRDEPDNDIAMKVAGWLSACPSRRALSAVVVNVSISKEEIPREVRFFAIIISRVRYMANK